MSNFQIDSSSIVFSTARSRNRLEKAVAVVGEKAVKRILGLALFLLGANRKNISEMLDMPIGTFFTFLTRFHKDGMEVFSTKRNALKSTVSKAESEMTNERHAVLNTLKILKKAEELKQINPLQHKVLVLSFLNWDMLSAKDASKLLCLSQQYTSKLGHKLAANDIEVLFDKRQGQQQDYQFSEAVKAELIQQFAFNVITGNNAGSTQLCQQVNKACETSVSDRSVRLYMNKLGLNKIKQSLFDMVAESKKNTKN